MQWHCLFRDSVVGLLVYFVIPPSACELMHFSRLLGAAGGSLLEECSIACRVQLMGNASAAARQCLKTTNATAGSNRYGRSRVNPADKSCL